MGGIGDIPGVAFFNPFLIGGAGGARWNLWWYDV